MKYPIVEYKGGLYYEGTVTESITKEELLTTYWDQEEPYGNNCPGGVAGCGPIAAAQIMAYHQHPAQFNGHTYNWNAMTATPTLSAGSTGAISAAELIYDIGYAAGIEYPQTGVGIYHLRNTIEFFNYNCAELPDLNVNSNYDIARVRENIDDELPVLISGYPNSGSGHAWVIDGYTYNNSSVTYYYTYAPYDVFESVQISSSTYFHCNLGWGIVPDQTYNNGYYYSNSFLYNNDLMVVYDITPNN